MEDKGLKQSLYIVDEKNVINDDIKNMIKSCKNLSNQSKFSFNELRFEAVNFIENDIIVLSNMTDMKLSKAMACFIGSAVGDATGVHTEFLNVNYNNTKYKTFDDLKILRQINKRCELGEFSDDTSMALCLADSLLYNEIFNL